MGALHGQQLARENKDLGPRFCHTPSNEVLGAVGALNTWRSLLGTNKPPCSCSSSAIAACNMCFYLNRDCVFCCRQPEPFSLDHGLKPSRPRKLERVERLLCVKPLLSPAKKFLTLHISFSVILPGSLAIPFPLHQ